METAISIERLAKTYPANQRLWGKETDKPVVAVREVSLSVERGELFGLLGPNGAGKTTLIKMLCTLIVPSSGSARIAGHDLKNDRAIRAVSGLVVSDERSFFWRLSVKRNLQFFAALHGLYDERAERRIKRVLKDVGLEDRLEQRFSNLSSGMRQRVAIARALLHEPEVLFLDEPTRSLDPIATAAMHRLISGLQATGDMTILLITHDLAEAEKLCARVALMDAGQMRRIGPPHELRRQLGQERRYVMSLPILPREVEGELQQLLPNLIVIRSADGSSEAQLQFVVNEKEGTLTDVFDQLRKHELVVGGIEGGPPSLEDVFAHYTGENGAATQ